MTSKRGHGSSPTGSGQSRSGQRAVGAGLTLAVSVGLFAYGGLWLDRQLGTKPWMLLLLSALGIVGGMLHLIREVAPEMWPFGDAAGQQPVPEDPDDRDRAGPTKP